MQVIKFTSRDITSVANLRNQITNTAKKKFTQTMRLAEYALKAKVYWKSADFKEDNKSVNVEELIREVFGCGKSYFYKLCRAAEGIEGDSDVIARYHELCDAVDASGDKPTERSLADFLAFLKDEEHHKDDSVSEDTDGESVSEDTEEETSGDDVLYTFSAPGVSIRVYADGRVVKDGDAAVTAVDDFLSAIGHTQG